jgi:Protein of unknown function (DUF3800)
MNKLSKFGFIDEVGLSVGDKSQPFMAIGMLSIADTSELCGQLYKLHYSYHAFNLTERKKLVQEITKTSKSLKFHELNNLFLKNRHHEFKYEALGFPNLDKYKEVVDLLIKYDFAFDSIIVDKASEDFDISKYGTYWHGYSKFVKLLIENTTPPNTTIIPILDFLHKPNNEIEIVTQLNNLDCVENSLQADSKCFLLLQITDLLLGAVVFEKKYEMGLFPVESNKIKARKIFNNYLKEKLNLNSLTNGTTNKPRHFNIWNFKPKKTRDNTHSARPSNYI